MSTSVDIYADGRLAHLSPRVRVGLTSSPTYGPIATAAFEMTTVIGRRVSLVSDILNVSESELDSSSSWEEI